MCARERRVRDPLVYGPPRCSREPRYQPDAGGNLMEPATQGPTPRSTSRARSRSRAAGTNGHDEAWTDELSAILGGLQMVRDGDFSVRLPGDWTGLAGKIADTFNQIVTANQQIAQELSRVGRVVGKKGRTRERARFHET